MLLKLGLQNCVQLKIHGISGGGIRFSWLKEGVCALQQQWASQYSPYINIDYGAVLILM